MKNQKSKALPEKINRYLIFGHWLSKELRLTDIKTTNIEDLFNLAQSYFYGINGVKRDFNKSLELFKSIYTDKSQNYVSIVN